MCLLLHPGILRKKFWVNESLALRIWVSQIIFLDMEALMYQSKIGVMGHSQVLQAC